MVAIVVIAILNGSSDDNTPSPAAEDAYVNQVAEHMYVIERDRQAFTDAGGDMCGIAGEHAAADSRQILVDHGLSDYAIRWKFISTAAAALHC